MWSKCTRNRLRVAPVALKADAGDVAGVSIVRHDRLWVVAGDVIHADLWVASCCEEAFVKGDLQAVDLC